MVIDSYNRIGYVSVYICYGRIPARLSLSVGQKPVLYQND